MLKSIENDLLHCLNMLEAMGKIQLYAQHIDNDDEFFLLNEQLNYNASLNLLAHLGETSYKISDALKELTPFIEWERIKALRNRVVHDYIGLDSLMIFQIIQQNLPVLQRQLISIIAMKLKQRQFDLNEYEISKESLYYRHIDFLEIDKCL